VVRNTGTYGHYTDQLGDRIFRVLFPGTCEPDRFPGKRRAFLTDGVKSNPGGDHPLRICDIFARGL